MNVSPIETVPSKTWLRAHGLSLIGLFVLVLLPLCLFGIIAEDVLQKENIFFDKPLLLFLHAHATTTLDSLMVFFSRAGSGLILVPLDIAVFLLLFMKQRRGQVFFWSLP